MEPINEAHRTSKQRIVFRKEKEHCTSFKGHWFYTLTNPLQTRQPTIHWTNKKKTNAKHDCHLVRSDGSFSLRHCSSTNSLHGKFVIKHFNNYDTVEDIFKTTKTSLHLYEAINQNKKIKKQQMWIYITIHNNAFHFILNFLAWHQCKTLHKRS